MTENEALELMKSLQISEDCELVKTFDFKATVIKALENLQQYRAIGTVEDIADGIKQSEEEFNMLMEYLNIGTIEEFKVLKEHSVGKKIVYVSNMGVKTPHCPNCDMELTMNMYQRKRCNMKGFIEKLIERLEEYKDSHLIEHDSEECLVLCQDLVQNKMRGSAS